MSQRPGVCLVTGATGGIGLAVARALANRGATVIIHGRDPDRLAAALELLHAEMPGADLHAVIADFASLAAVRQMAADLLSRFERIDVLINNAGLLTDHRQVSADGYELTFAVNHLAPFLLTGLLSRHLIASAPARIAFNSSSALGGGYLDFDNLQLEQDFGGWQAYANTKLANMLVSNLLARKLDGTGVVSNAFCPGLIDTGLLKGNREFGPAAIARLQPGMRTPENGAITPVWLATSADAASINGAFFLKSHGGGRQPVQLDWDLSTAERLWAVSLQMTGLPDWP